MVASLPASCALDGLQSLRDEPRGRLEAFQEIGVGGELLETAEKELHGLDLVRAGQRAPELVDLRKLFRRVELLLFARARRWRRSRR
jgi:hypothetical protein